jgi:FKBP12-rapamycin complex-associated protein
LCIARAGKQHPQSLIYPLTVASKSQSPMRKKAADAITSNMRQHFPNLVDQACTL